MKRLANDVVASMSAIAQRATPMPPYVRTLRVRHARQLLAASRRSSAAIAEVGFADPSHLSRTFAALLHVTPKVYQ